jgi:hypothetical protein
MNQGWAIELVNPLISPRTQYPEGTSDTSPEPSNTLADDDRRQVAHILGTLGLPTEHPCQMHFSSH